MFSFILCIFRELNCRFAAILQGYYPDLELHVTVTAKFRPYKQKCVIKKIGSKGNFLFFRDDY
jgi:hypothetical protein